MQESLPSSPQSVELKQKREEKEAGERFVVGSRTEAARMITQRFEERLKKRFPPDKYPFHNVEHSAAVARDSREFLEVVAFEDPSLVSEEDYDYLEMEAWAHDLAQEAFTDPKAPRIRKRGYRQGEPPHETDISPAMRARGARQGNERASAEELLEELGKYYFANGERVFPMDDRFFRETVSDDIGATYPDFDFTARLPDGRPGLKIYQPYLTRHATLRGLALANADLRGPLKNPDALTFQKSGDAEFRELHQHTLGEEIEEIARDREDMKPEQREEIQKRRAEIAEMILSWKKSQPGFAEQQRILFLKTLEDNFLLNAGPRALRIREKLRERYGIRDDGNGAFDKNIAAAQEHYKLLESTYGSLRDPKERARRLASISDDDFRSLAREIGYVVR